MCGRITQQLSTDQVGELYGVRATPLPPDQPPRYNGAPGQDFTACRVEQHGTRALVRLRWGLVPSWARDPRTGSRLINARAESVHFKPSFRAAFRLRRCLLPVDGWFDRSGDVRMDPSFRSDLLEKAIRSRLQQLAGLDSAQLVQRGGLPVEYVCVPWDRQYHAPLRLNRALAGSVQIRPGRARTRPRRVVSRSRIRAGKYSL